MRKGINKNLKENTILLVSSSIIISVTEVSNPIKLSFLFLELILLIILVTLSIRNKK